MTCGKGIHNSITHSNSAKKTSVEAVWRPPTDFEGDVVFRYSALEEFDKYWVRLDAGSVRVSREAATEAPQTTTTTTTEEAVVFPGSDGDQSSRGGGEI